MGLFLQVRIKRKELGAYNEPWIFFFGKDMLDPIVKDVLDISWLLLKVTILMTHMRDGTCSYCCISIGIT